MHPTPNKLLDGQCGLLTVAAICMSDRRAKWDIARRDAKVRAYPTPAGSLDSKGQQTPLDIRQLRQTVWLHLLSRPASEKVRQHARNVIFASKISVLERATPRGGTVRCWCQMRSPIQYEHDSANDPMPFIANALECPHPGGPSKHLDFYFWFAFPESVFA